VLDVGGSVYAVQPTDDTAPWSMITVGDSTASPPTVGDPVAVIDNMVKAYNGQLKDGFYAWVKPGSANHSWPECLYLQPNGSFSNAYFQIQEPYVYWVADMTNLTGQNFNVRTFLTAETLTTSPVWQTHLPPAKRVDIDELYDVLSRAPQFTANDNHIATIARTLTNFAGRGLSAIGATSLGRGVSDASEGVGQAAGLISDVAKMFLG